MVDPITTAATAKTAKKVKDVTQKPVKSAGDVAFKVFLLILLAIITILLIVIIAFIIFGWVFPSSNNTFIPYPGAGPGESGSYSSGYNYTNYINAHYPGPGSLGGECYWAYICPGVPPAPTCDDCTDENRSCYNNSECCSGCCEQFSINYPIGDIPGQTAFVGGICKPIERCQQQCKNYAQTCTNTSQCCDGYCCKSMGGTYKECRPNLECNSCTENTQLCSSSSECCSGCCNDGLCSLETQCCHEETQTCSGSSDCCYGLDCIDGLCQQPECKNYATQCETNDDCCSGCCKNMGGTYKECRLENECSASCNPIGGSCLIGADCCSTVCLGNNTCGCIQGGYSCPVAGSCCSPYECVTGMCVIP